MFDFFGFVKFRYEVRNRDINKPPSRDGQNPERELFPCLPQNKCGQGSQYGAQSRQEVEPERARLGVTGMKEHRKVPYLLRDFVEYHRKCGGYAYRDAYEKACADDYAVYEIMHPVGEQDELPRRMNALFRLILAVVVPVHKLFQDKKKNNAENYENAHGSRAYAALECFRNEMNERVAQERTDREGNEHEDILFQNVFLY